MEDCPGGTGRDGRGFKHAKSVPCTNPVEHLRHGPGLSTSDHCVHPANVPMIPELYGPVEEYETVQRNLAMVRPGAFGWCPQCASWRDDPPASMPKRRRTQAGARP
jgi:hypothetical protein